MAVFIRPIILDISVAGHPLDKKRKYRFATNDFLYNGGDGYDMLKSGKLIVSPSDGTLLTTAVIDHMLKNSPIGSRHDERIIQK